MRTILVGIYLVIFCIISIPLFVVEFVIGKFNKRLQAHTSQVIVRSALKGILAISGMKVTISGVENIPLDKPVLYVSNHRGIFDFVLAYVSVPNLTGFVSKIENKKIPFIRTWMEFLNCLFLDRDNIKEGLKTILTGIEKIKDGYSIFIMPEGTRNKGEGILPFHEGSFKLSQKTGCPIIPVAIANTDEAFEKHKPWIKKTNLAIRYGEPIYTENLEKEEKKFLGVYARGIIAGMLEEM